MKNNIRAIVPVIALVGAATFAGCSHENVGYGSITSNLTPELHGLSQRPSDAYSAFAITTNQNLRMFWDDLGRTLYYEQPMRLSPFPVTNVSGQPR
jgi:hypothetical protein